MNQNNSTPKNYKPDYSVAKLAGAGIAGFFICTIILFSQDFLSFCKPDSVFHEVHYNPRELAAACLQRNASETGSNVDKYYTMLSQLNADTAALKSHIQKLTEESKLLRAKTDSILAIKKLLKEDTAKLNQLNKYIGYYEGLSSADTLSFKRLNNLLHFNITADTLENWENIYIQKGDTAAFRVTCAFKDPEMKILDTIGCTTTLRIQPVPPSDISFLAKYPATGIWVLLLLVFTSLCFVIIPSAISLKNKAERVFMEENYYPPGLYTYRKILLIVLALFAITLLLWKVTFFDSAVVKNIFFMKNMTIKLGWIITVGIITGSFCMAGFIHTASMLSFFAKPLARLRKEINNLGPLNPSQQAAQQPDPNNLSSDAALKEKMEEESSQKKIFTALAGIFQSYFMMSAFILSLTVLCTGALFHAIGSLDFVKLLEDDWGFSPVRSDFIYFYGALFTIVLLLVYIPARIKFNEVDAWKTGLTAPASDKEKWYDILKNPFASFKDILVATSPLLVSFAQTLFDYLFQ